MAAWICSACGYDLGGLRTEEGATACPECGLQNRLGAELSYRRISSVPLILGTLPVLLGGAIGSLSPKAMTGLVVFGVFGGVGLAGVLAYRRAMPKAGFARRTTAARWTIAIVVGVGALFINSWVARLFQTEL